MDNCWHYEDFHAWSLRCKRWESWWWSSIWRLIIVILCRCLIVLDNVWAEDSLDYFIFKECLAIFLVTSRDLRCLKLKALAVESSVMRIDMDMIQNERADWQLFCSLQPINANEGADNPKTASSTSKEQQVSFHYMLLFSAEWSNLWCCFAP